MRNSTAWSRRTRLRGARATGAALAAAAELAFDQRARGAPARRDVARDTRHGQQQERHRDQVAHHAGEDEEQAGDDGARAAGELSLIHISEPTRQAEISY